MIFRHDFSWFLIVDGVDFDTIDTCEFMCQNGVIS